MGCNSSTDRVGPSSEPTFLRSFLLCQNEVQFFQNLDIVIDQLILCSENEFKNVLDCLRFRISYHGANNIANFFSLLMLAQSLLKNPSLQKHLIEPKIAEKFIRLRSSFLLPVTNFLKDNEELPYSKRTSHLHLEIIQLLADSSLNKSRKNPFKLFKLSNLSIFPRKSQYVSSNNFERVQSESECENFLKTIKNLRYFAIEEIISDLKNNKIEKEGKYKNIYFRKFNHFKDIKLTKMNADFRFIYGLNHYFSKIESEKNFAENLFHRIRQSIHSKESLESFLQNLKIDLEKIDPTSNDQLQKIANLISELNNSNSKVVKFDSILLCKNTPSFKWFNNDNKPLFQERAIPSKQKVVSEIIQNQNIHNDIPTSADPVEIIKQNTAKVDCHFRKSIEWPAIRVLEEKKSLIFSENKKIFFEFNKINNLSNEKMDFTSKLKSSSVNLNLNKINIIQKTDNNLSSKEHQRGHMNSEDKRPIENILDFDEKFPIFEKIEGSSRNVKDVQDFNELEQKTERTRNSKHLLIKPVGQIYSARELSQKKNNRIIPINCHKRLLADFDLEKTSNKGENSSIVIKNNSIRKISFENQNKTKPINPILIDTAIQKHIEVSTQSKTDPEIMNNSSDLVSRKIDKNSSLNNSETHKIEKEIFSLELEKNRIEEEVLRLQNNSKNSYSNYIYSSLSSEVFGLQKVLLERNFLLESIEKKVMDIQSDLNYENQKFQHIYLSIIRQHRRTSTISSMNRSCVSTFDRLGYRRVKKVERLGSLNENDKFLSEIFGKIELSLSRR